MFHVKHVGDTLPLIGGRAGKTNTGDEVMDGRIAESALGGKYYGWDGVGEVWQDWEGEAWDELSEGMRADRGPISAFSESLAV